MKKMPIWLIACLLSSCAMLPIYEDHVKSKAEILDGIVDLEFYINEQIDKYKLDRVSIAIFFENETVYDVDVAGNVNSPCLGSQGNRNSPLWMAVG